MTTKLSPNFINHSVSHATLKPEHLVERLSNFLRTHAPEKMQEIEGEYIQILDDVLELLFDSLNGVAPDGTSFGAHEGDGSDFGFWQYEDETGDE